MVYNRCNEMCPEHRCELCQRLVFETTRHHLIPRARHSNRRIRKKHGKEKLKKTVDLCDPCHSQVHRLLSEKELEATYNTLERLAGNSEIARYLNWVRNKRPDLKL